MSLHKSLIVRNKLARMRNVLTRWERLERLGQKERWKPGDSVFGLPKTSVGTKVKAKKAAKKEATEEDGTEEKTEAT